MRMKHFCRADRFRLRWISSFHLDDVLKQEEFIIASWWSRPRQNVLKTETNEKNFHRRNNESLVNKEKKFVEKGDLIILFTDDKSKTKKMEKFPSPTEINGAKRREMLFIRLKDWNEKSFRFIWYGRWRRSLANALWKLLFTNAQNQLKLWPIIKFYMLTPNLQSVLCAFEL